MADSETRTYLIWNKDSVTTYITSIDFTNDAGVSHRVNFPGSWDGPYAGQTDFTSNTTRITQDVVYVSDVGDELKQYISHTGTNLTINSTADLYIGYTLLGNGYTQGQTIVGFTSSTVVTSDIPDGIPEVGENIQFSPPQYLLLVNNNSGVGINWVATGNGYSGQTVLGSSSTDYLIMSNPPTVIPTPGGTITFTSDQTVLTLSAGTSSTFTARYSNNTTVLGTYPASFTIRAESTTTIIKQISNFIGINTAPVDSGSGGDGWDSGGYGGDSGDAGVSTGVGDGPGNSAGNANAGDGGNGSSADGSGSDGATASA